MGHNTKSLINLKLLTKKVDLPHSKKANFGLFINTGFKSLERLLLYRDRRQTRFLHLCLINIKD